MTQDIESLARAKVIPVYFQWEEVPKGLFTKTQLQQERLKIPNGVQAVAAKKSFSPVRYFPLYRREDAVPIRIHKFSPHVDYIARFEQRYGSRRSAYKDACDAMFQLNRYAKQDSCNHQHRDLIYSLKNRLIRMLWVEGFCIESEYIPPEEKLCQRCEGDDSDSERPCATCKGSGTYARPNSGYWTFHFCVDGKFYSWHHPELLVSIWIKALGEQTFHEVLSEEKPMTLAFSKFAHAKALINWVTS